MVGVGFTATSMRDARATHPNGPNAKSTADRTVNSADIGQTKSQSGQAVSSSNFREDVTLNGLIDSQDVQLVTSKQGTALP